MIEDRKRLHRAEAATASNARPAKTDAELRYWLDNAWCTTASRRAEAGAALGLTADEVDGRREAARHRPAKRPNGRPATRSSCCRIPAGGTRGSASATGRSARSGRPRSSVFAPWAGGGYAVADVPEAVWFEPARQDAGTALPGPHPRADRLGTSRSVTLDPLEWTRQQRTAR